MEEHICRFNTDADNPSKQPNIARAQARGEVAPGDPRLHAFSLIGPMVMVMPFREVFGGVGTDPPDLGLCIPRLLRRPRRRSGIKASTGGRGPMKKQRIYLTHQLCPVN
jgi:hypothetical protein